MISPRILSRKEWEPHLTGRGCKRISDVAYLRLETAEYWITPNGKVVTVPVDNDEGRLRADDLHVVLIEIERLKPIGEI